MLTQNREEAGSVIYSRLELSKVAKRPIRVMVFTSTFNRWLYRVKGGEDSFTILSQNNTP